MKSSETLGFSRVFTQSKKKNNRTQRLNFGPSGSYLNILYFKLLFENMLLFMLGDWSKSIGGGRGGPEQRGGGS